MTALSDDTDDTDDVIAGSLDEFLFLVAIRECSHRHLQVQAQADAAGDVGWLVQIDSAVVRTHQHAAATGRKGGTVSRTNRRSRGEHGGRPAIGPPAAP